MQRSLIREEYPLRARLTIVAALIPAIAYLIFIRTYAVNIMFWDEWQIVPILHGFLHGTVSFNSLWALHNENRMLVPNVILGASQFIFGHYSSKTTIYLSAILFILSWFIFVSLYRKFSGESLGPIATLFIGGVWFSLIDTDNSLWAFQFAWYLIVFFLFAVFSILSSSSLTWKSIVLAGVIALAASFSSLQGLIIWPIGFIAIIWGSDSMDRRRKFLGAWILVAVVSATIYFLNYTAPPSPIGSGGLLRFSFKHFSSFIQFFLAELGNVFAPLGMHQLVHAEIVGAVLLLQIAYLLISQVRSYFTSRSFPLPLLLVGYGVIFDLLTDLGRLYLGVGYALTSRYTMPSLLIMVGIGSFYYRILRQNRAASFERSQSRTVFRIAAFSVLAAIAGYQIGLTSNNAIPVASYTKAIRTFSARTVANLDRIPKNKRASDITVDTFYNYADVLAYISIAQKDEIGVFAPGTLNIYRTEGPG